jgi:hypothetical protein
VDANLNTTDTRRGSSYGYAAPRLQGAEIPALDGAFFWFPR